MLFMQNAFDHIMYLHQPQRRYIKDVIQVMITLSSATFTATTDVTAIHVDISDEAVLQTPALVRMSSLKPMCYYTCSTRETQRLVSHLTTMNPTPLRAS